MRYSIDYQIVNNIYVCKKLNAFALNNEVVAKWKAEGFLESLFLRQTRNGEIWC